MAIIDRNPWAIIEKSLAVFAISSFLAAWVLALWFYEFSPRVNPGAMEASHVFKFHGAAIVLSEGQEFAHKFLYCASGVFFIGAVLVEILANPFRKVTTSK